MKKAPESKEKSDNKSNNSGWKGNKKKGSANMVTGTTADSTADPENTPCNRQLCEQAQTHTTDHDVTSGTRRERRDRVQAPSHAGHRSRHNMHEPLPRRPQWYKIHSLLGLSQTRREQLHGHFRNCLLYTSPSPRDLSTSRMPSSA